MKRYEGLFILETAAKEEGIKDAIDKISAEITTLGGKVETVQKMDKKSFSRVADKKHTAGFYVNIIFEGQPALVDQLKHRFAMNEDVFRVLFTNAPAPKPATTTTNCIKETYGQLQQSHPRGQPDPRPGTALHPQGHGHRQASAWPSTGPGRAKPAKPRKR